MQNIHSKQITMVVFSSRLHEKTTLVVPFGGHLPQDGEAEWPWDLHLDRLQGFCGLSTLLLLQLDFAVLCSSILLSKECGRIYPLGGTYGGDGEFKPDTMRFVALFIQ